MLGKILATDYHTLQRPIGWPQTQCQEWKIAPCHCTICTLFDLDVDLLATRWLYPCYNNNNNNRIYISPYGRNFIRGAGGRSDQCSV